jgi:hypothetical protein
MNDQNAPDFFNAPRQISRLSFHGFISIPKVSVNFLVLNTEYSGLAAAVG